MSARRIEVDIRFVNGAGLDPEDWWDYDMMDEVIKPVSDVLPAGTAVTFSYLGAHVVREQNG